MDTSLAENIERQILHRTCGRVHGLQVDLCDGRVVVQGATSSYYVKQLAIASVLDTLRKVDRPAAADFRIEVDR